MLYIVWSAPVIVAVSVLVLGGRSSFGAGVCGAIVASGVALIASPLPFDFRDEILSIGRGAWLSWLVGSVILGGLFFKEATSRDVIVGSPEGEARQRKLFFACFLLGPFAESATGFGVGQVTVGPTLQRLGLASPVHAARLGLLSQVMVPWGALANGTIVGAQLSGLPPATLGYYSAVLTLALLPAWLTVYWSMAAKAGLSATFGERANDLCWTVMAGVLLIIANLCIGPEVAALSALAPLVIMRFIIDERPDRHRLLEAGRHTAPYAVLIVGLALSRAIPTLARELTDLLTLQPFEPGPPWSPLLHPATWLVTIGGIAGLVRGGTRRIRSAAVAACIRGRASVLSILAFMVMADILTHSGIAGALAVGADQALGPVAALSVPLVAALFGFLTSSSSTSNGLLMPTQAALARASGRGPEWVAALQNTAAAALTMLSPVRVAMGCALIGRSDDNRAVYAGAWPLGATALCVLAIAALLVH